MDVSTTLASLGPLEPSPPVTGASPTPAALRPPAADAARPPLPAAITDAPGVPPSVIAADVERLPPAIRYAPSPAPHVTGTPAFDERA